MPEPPTPDEARLMGLEDVILVGSVREKVRTHALVANSAGIMNRIKAWGSVDLEPCERPVGFPAPAFVPPPGSEEVGSPAFGMWAPSPGPANDSYTYDL